MARINPFLGDMVPDIGAYVSNYFYLRDRALEWEVSQGTEWLKRSEDDRFRDLTNRDIINASVIDAGLDTKYFEENRSTLENAVDRAVVEFDEQLASEAGWQAARELGRFAVKAGTGVAAGVGTLYVAGRLMERYGNVQLNRRQLLTAGGLLGGTIGCDSSTTTSPATPIPGTVEGNISMYSQGEGSGGNAAGANIEFLSGGGSVGSATADNNGHFKTSTFNLRGVNRVAITGESDYSSGFLNTSEPIAASFNEGGNVADYKVLPRILGLEKILGTDQSFYDITHRDFTGQNASRGGKDVTSTDFTFYINTTALQGLSPGERNSRVTMARNAISSVYNYYTGKAAQFQESTSPPSPGKGNILVEFTGAGQRGVWRGLVLDGGELFFPITAPNDTADRQETAGLFFYHRSSDLIIPSIGNENIAPSGNFESVDSNLRWVRDIEGPGRMRNGNIESYRA